MGFCGISWEFNEIKWDFVGLWEEFHGIWCGLSGIQWCLMVFNDLRSNNGDDGDMNKRNVTGMMIRIVEINPNGFGEFELLTSSNHIMETQTFSQCFYSHNCNLPMGFCELKRLCLKLGDMSFEAKTYEGNTINSWCLHRGTCRAASWGRAQG